MDPVLQAFASDARWMAETKVCNKNLAEKPTASQNGDGKATVAFAFDIDGVLVRGKQAIRGAAETLLKLRELEIPFILLTNGGGLTEKDHAKRVSDRLGVAITADQFVQSHTPYHDLVATYADKTILALGGSGNLIRKLAEDYGFKHVLTTSDMIAETKDVHPFPEMTLAHHEEHGRPSPYGLGLTEIAAILVWSSPRDWCLDLQVVYDLMSCSGGFLSPPHHRFRLGADPALFFCNPDFEWATPYHKPRFAQGAFREALRGIWAHGKSTDQPLHFTIVGKPTFATFSCAERMLRAYNATLNQDLDEPKSINKVYMVGDNPESDIRGANAFQSSQGIPWKSLLVETGVYPAGSIPTCPPTHIASDVVDAVNWALGQEGSRAQIHRSNAKPQVVTEDDFEVGDETGFKLPALDEDAFGEGLEGEALYLSALL